MLRILFALALASTNCLAWSQATTPVGLWKTIDDESKKEKSLVRIADAGGVLVGRIEKNQPVIGLTIIRGVKPHDDDKELWEGGDILDPNNGKVYKLRLKPTQGGKRLEVRGYIGMPLLGRTQTWIRVE